MFRKLKDKIVEEVRQAPRRLPTPIQSTFVASQIMTKQQDDVSVDDKSLANSAEESPGPIQTPPEGASFETVDLSDLATSTPKSEHGKIFTDMSKSSSIFPEYIPPSQHFLHSDLESASEVDETFTSLDRIPKEQIFQSFKKAKNRYLRYRMKYVEAVKAYRDLEQNQKKLEITLSKTQDVSLRKISELREESLLEKQVKSDMEENFNMMLGEKDCKINALQTQVRLLKDRLGEDFLKLDAVDIPLIDWTFSPSGDVISEDEIIVPETFDDHATVRKGKDDDGRLNNLEIQTADSLQHRKLESIMGVSKELQLKLDAAEQILHETKDQKKLLQEELAATKISMAKTSSQLAYILEEKTCLDSQIAELKNLVNQLEEDKKQKDLINVNLLHELSSLKSENKIVVTSLTAASDENKDLQYELKKEQRALSCIQDEFKETLSGFATRAQELEQSLEQANLEKNDFYKELQMYKKTIESSEMNYEILKTDLEKYQVFVDNVYGLFVDNNLTTQTCTENQNADYLGDLYRRLQEVVVIVETARRTLREAEHAKEFLLHDIQTEREHHVIKLGVLEVDITKCNTECNTGADYLQNLGEKKNTVFQELCALKTRMVQERDSNVLQKMRFQEMLAVKDQETQTVAKQLIVKEQELQELFANNEKSELNFKDMENELSESLGKRLALEDTIKSIRTNMEKELNDLTGENDLLRKELLDIKKSRKDVMATRVDELTEFLRKAEDNNQVLSVVVQELEKECVSHHQKQNDLESTQVKLLSELEVVRLEKMEIESRTKEELARLKACVRSQQETLLSLHHEKLKTESVLEVNKKNYNAALKDVNQRMLNELQAVQNCEAALRAELDTIRRELDTIKLQFECDVSKFSLQVEKLIMENQSLSESNISLRLELDEHEKYCIKLNTENLVETLKAELENKEAIVLSVRVELKKIENMLNQFVFDAFERKEPFDNFCKLIEFVRSKLTDFQSKYDQLLHEKNVMMVEVEQFREELTEKQLEVRQLKEIHISQLRDLRDQTSKTIDELKNKVQELNEEKAAEQSLLQSFKTELEKYKLHSVECEKELEAAEHFKIELDNFRIKELELLQRHEQVKKRLEEEVRKVVHESQHECNSLTAQLHSFKERFTIVSQELESAKHQLQKMVVLEEQLKDAEGKSLNSTKMHTLAMENMESEWKSKSTQLHSKFKAKFQELKEKQKQQIDRLERRIESCMLEKNECEQELNEATAKFVNLEKQVKLLKFQLDEKCAAFENEVGKNNDLDEKNKVLVNESTTKGLEIEELQTIIEQLHVEKVMIETDLHKCPTDHDLKLTALEDELDQKVALLEVTRNDYSKVSHILQENSQNDTFENQGENSAAVLGHSFGTIIQPNFGQVVDKLQQEISLIPVNVQTTDDGWNEKILHTLDEHQLSHGILTKKHAEETQFITNELENMYEPELSQIQENISHEVEDKSCQTEENHHVLLQVKSLQIHKSLEDLKEKSQIEKSQMHREHEANVRQLHLELREKEAILEELHERHLKEKKEKDHEFTSRLLQLEQQIGSIKHHHSEQLEKQESNWKDAFHKQLEEQSQRHDDKVKGLMSEWKHERQILEEQNRLSVAAVESSCETNELLRIQVLTMSNKLAEIKQQSSVEISDLGAANSCIQSGHVSQGEVKDFPAVETLLNEPTQIKYLRNVLFEYMLGKQTTTLAKVIATILNFTEEETRQILEKEEGRHTMVPHFLT